MKYFWIGLGLVFITLKLTEVIDWSWWLVLLPLIILGTVRAIPWIFLTIFALMNNK